MLSPSGGFINNILFASFSLNISFKEVIVFLFVSSSINNELSISIQRLKKSGIRVSLFIDPDPKQIESSLMAGANAVEIHTGLYADSLNPNDQDYELERIKECAKHAKKIGLHVNAGHGLNYQNTASISSILEITELNIGHAIVARSVITGMAEAVKEMKTIMESSRK